MRAIRWSLPLLVVSLWIPGTTAQPPFPKPGPEQALLKQLEGVWDATAKAGPMESKATATFKMDLGGLWLVSEFQGSFGGQPFQGRGLDSYDPIKKKYISVWVDSMSTSPMITEGSFDKDGKVLTMTGEGPGPDGKPSKYKTVTEIKDKDTMAFTLSGVGKDGKEEVMVTVNYKRKK